METPHKRSFRTDPSEHQLRHAVGRSGSSEPLLESVPSSHCMAAATGEEELVVVIPNHQKQKTVGYYDEEEAAVATHKKAVVVASVDKPPSPTDVVAEGCGGGQGKGTPCVNVGRLFYNKVSFVGEGGTSSQDVEEQEQERKGKKGKQKKRWSWMPDPEKRWPVQGWS